MLKNQVSIKLEQATNYRFVEEMKDKKLIDAQYQIKQDIKERIKKYIKLDSVNLG